MHDPLEFNPTAGLAEPVGQDIRRILAPNPSPMTFRGTNTYLIGTKEVAVVDPGPDSDPHLAAIEQAVGQGAKITHILVTHAHLDHSPLARRLSDRSGAPVYAFGDAQAGQSQVMQSLALQGLAGGGEGVDHSFVPDIALQDKQTVALAGKTVTAHWTPGHFGNHLCFALEDTVFTGDLVMGWSTSLVSPPDGDLTQFMSSCEKLLQLGIKTGLPGHGAALYNLPERLSWLIQHRKSRESQILDQLTQGKAEASALAEAIYQETPKALLPAATRNVFAHLVDLHGKNKVMAEPELSASAQFSLKSVR